MAAATGFWHVLPTTLTSDYAQVIEERLDLNAEAAVRYSYGDDLVAQHRRTSPTITESRTFYYDRLG